jgi:hypothetical protein
MTSKRDYPPVATLQRELTDEEIQEQVEQLLAYMAKPGNRGVSVWLSGKGFADGDRRAILLAYGEQSA